MLRQLRAPVVMLLGFTLITGLVYPLAVSGFAWVMMHDAALGSLIVKDGKVVGSSLVGQDFTATGISIRARRPRIRPITRPHPPARTSVPSRGSCSTGRGRASTRCERRVWRARSRSMR